MTPPGRGDVHRSRARYRYASREADEDVPLSHLKAIATLHHGAMESTRTISELKSSFIRAQVRILSESLEPPEDWRNYAAETEEDDLSNKVVGDVLQKCKSEHSYSICLVDQPGILAPLFFFP